MHPPDCTAVILNDWQCRKNRIDDRERYQANGEPEPIVTAVERAGQP
jgi:hypothetical protein